MTRPDPTLRDLIDGAMHRHQVKHVSNLERIAKRAGHKIVATTINGIRNGTYNSEPTRHTLAALAFLAGVTPEVAYAAAGLPVPGPPFAESLPDGVDLLTPREREAVIGVLRAMVDARRSLEDPRIPPGSYIPPEDEPPVGDDMMIVNRQPAERPKA